MTMAAGIAASQFQGVMLIAASDPPDVWEYTGR
jgi:hypothetical protein